MKPKRRLGGPAFRCLTAAALLGSGGFVGAVAAPDTQPGPTSGFDFGVRPSSPPGAPVRAAFTFEVAAGQTVTDSVEVLNSGDRPKPVSLYPADAYTTEVGGGFALHLRTEPRRDAASWLAIPVDRYTVPAHSGALIPIKVSVPPDASPGDHTAGVVAEEEQPAVSVDRGAGVVPVHRVAARVYVRVSGPVHPALQIQDLRVSHHQPVIPYVTGRGSVTVTFTLVNSGNTRAQLDHVDFKVQGLFGRAVHRAAFDRASDGQLPAGLPDQIIPGSRIQFSRTFAGSPLLDALTARVTVHGRDPLLGGPIGTSRTKGFWAFPWPLAAFVLAALAGVAARRRWRRRTATPSLTP